MLHADDDTKSTRRSGNVLDVDGDYAEVLGSALQFLVNQVDLALAINAEVIVRVLPGNHDEDSALAATLYLAAWYRNEPRVKVDIAAHDFWFYKHGRVMLAANHGHACKAKDLPMVMAAREAKMWGETVHRYAHSFHIHNSQRDAADDARSALWETHRSPAMQDAYHYNKGFPVARNLVAISYHAERGERGRVIESL